jgi:hypothetical protein
MRRKNLSNSIVLLSITLGVTAFCTGCSHTVDVARIQPPYKVTIYGNGTYSPERTLPSGSAQAQDVTTWVESHKSGWSPSLVTYVPYRLLRGEGFELNFQQKTCILNYRTGVGWTQVMRAIDAGDVPPVFDRAP